MNVERGDKQAWYQTEDTFEIWKESTAKKNKFASETWEKYCAANFVRLGLGIKKLREETTWFKKGYVLRF